jgi:uncharacterized protein involved in cysteine biosynthesis
MITAFFLSLRQLGDPLILRLLGKVIGLTLLFFAGLGALGFFGLRAAFAWAGWQEGSGLAAAASAALIAIFGAILLFRVVALLVMNIFADEVVEAVEARHYPNLAARAQPPHLLLGLRMGLASAARGLIVNIAVLPAYILLLVTGVGSALLFLLVNGWLIGRDLQDMVLARHRAPGEKLVSVARQGGLPGGERFALGLIVTLLLLVPFVNLLAPVLGAAMTTHRVHRQAAVQEESA